jgi:glycosyltransferase involved in cell wall biosynthesis
MSTALSQANLVNFASSPIRAKSAQALHVVIVDEELPYPPTSGKRVRSLNLALRLARRHRLTYLCCRHRNTAEALQARVFFLDHGIRTVLVDRPVRHQSTLGHCTRLAANLLSPLPWSVDRHTIRPLGEAIRQYAANNRVDLWQCEGAPCAEAMRVLPGARWLVMAHHIESQIWQRYRDHEHSPVHRWFAAKQMYKCLRFEARIFGEALSTVTVSPDDAALARWAFAAPRVDIVDNGVDTVLFQPPQTPRRTTDVLFLGNLDARANLDAAGKLLKRIWPAVVAAEPDARLQIVGRNPPAWLRRRIAGTPRTQLHTSVIDVRPFLTSCGVLAVPLRIAGGSRLKILEALACETPVVSTKIGAEGLALSEDEHLTIVADNNGMAQPLIDCIRSPEIAHAQAVRGREFVRQHHDWDRLANKLEQVWLECAAVSPAVTYLVNKAAS